MRVIHTSHEFRSDAPAGTGDWLEIRRGRTKFPHRPLTASRCLIGSGTNCHLQLAGDVPLLHSLLVLDEGRWTLEVIAPEPKLFINGEASRHRELCVGDCIQLGDFEFALCRGEGGPQEPAPRRLHHRQFPSGSDRDVAARLTAAELVERMESELDVMLEFDEGRRECARALLEAIRQRPAILRMSDVNPHRESDPPQHVRKAA